MADQTEQLSSLVQLVSHQLDPANRVSFEEKSAWVSSALRGRKSLVLFLTRLVIDPETPKREKRLALLLLCLLVNMVHTLDAETSTLFVLKELASVEGFWAYIRSLVCDDESNSHDRVHALALLTAAYKLNNQAAKDQPVWQDWPSLIFGENIVFSVLSLIAVSHYPTAGSSQSRLLQVSVEYLFLLCEHHKDRFHTILSTHPEKRSIVVSLAEVSAQLLISTDRCFIGFDPVCPTFTVQEDALRSLANELVEIAGKSLHTNLALMISTMDG